MYNYIAHILPNDYVLARRVILEADRYGMKEEVLYHMFSPRTKGILQIDKGSSHHPVTVPQGK